MKESWAQCPIVKDHFWEATDMLPLNAPSQFESTNEEDNAQYLTLFDDHPDEEGILITSRSILRMRDEIGNCRRT